MMLWKNLKPGTIVDACVGMSRRRAEKLEAAEAGADRPAAGERPGPEIRKTAPESIRESIQPAE